MGKTWYDALQIKVTQRFSHGLTASGKFSWSKALTIGTEIGEPNPGTTGNAVVNNVFNRDSNKYISRYDQPFFFNTSLNYIDAQTRARTRSFRQCSRTGPIGAFVQYASGFPLQVVPSAQSCFEYHCCSRVPALPTACRASRCSRSI